MKRTAFAVAATLALGAGDRLRWRRFRGLRTGPEVTPQYEQVNVPRKECYSEMVPQKILPIAAGPSPARSSVASPAACSARASAQGNGRVATAAAGAVVGAIVGDQSGEPRSGRRIRRARGAALPHGGPL